MKRIAILNLLVIVVLGGCRKSNVRADEEVFTGVFKAEQVKEGGTIVYTLGATNNIIPGYSKFRLAFLPNAKSVRITEYTGETFEGKWNYSASNSLLTLNQLNPAPYAGNFVFKVEEMKAGRLILLNTAPNPKTGETINRYVLIPE